MRVLITGASGFVGGRVAECMAQNDDFEPIRLVRRWSAAARIGRLAIRLVQGDILRAADLRGAMEGVEEVVHCAHGPGDTALVGARNVLTQAGAAGVSHIVHVSTAEVYGAASGIVTESGPITPAANAYVAAKQAAETQCIRARDSGVVGVIVLRPTIIYGPFSKSWTIRYAERFAQGRWGTLGSLGSGFANLLYVDDLAAIIARVLTHSDARGQAFNVNGPDVVTWNSYFQQLGESLGYTVLPLATRVLRARARTVAPARRLAQALLRRYRVAIMRLYTGTRAARGMMRVPKASCEWSRLRGNWRCTAA